ncbi:MAG: type II toxin-antitoxin system VapC family toxin [Planctomycetota bacterium]|nr:type II toxin-antitoxin system VapC family toxin [Planctomycetota bacterium]
MRVLVDTHTLLFFVDDSPRLPPRVKSIIEQEDTEAFVSSASLWEITIKYGLGHLQLSVPLERLLHDQLVADDIVPLPILPAHLVTLSVLPQRKHRDPFDRLIAATCLAEDLILLSKDTEFDPYGIRRVW